MKLCRTCQRPLNRGSSGGIGGNQYTCLVCQVARAMATFKMPRRTRMPVEAPRSHGDARGDMNKATERTT